MPRRGLFILEFSILFVLSSFLFCGAYTIENYPKRIISLAPSITEELYLLEAQDFLVGNTTYCVTPPAARYKEKVGSITRVDLERIVGLNPDLVLATSLTNSKTIQKLKSLNIEVKLFPAPKNFTSLCDQFLELGKAVGKEPEAKEIVKTAEEKVARIKSMTAMLIKPKVFIEIGAKPLFTANRDYIINDFVKLAGGKNIAEDSKIHAYSKEEVLRKNADIILIVTMGFAGGTEKEAWQKFKMLNAVKHDRIYIIDSQKICGPTPVTFVKTLEEISALLHPELSEKKR
ncbi:MAG: helical backbone metal receptor [Candidatus Omnitrophica bacterium]|nr:helical backbone metal receptor [Candidatus Omnitrophota bacterium]